MREELEHRLTDRLTREPSASSVPKSLPVLFFGDAFSARVATIGLNPSKREYLDRHGRLLAENRRRFETTESLAIENRRRCVGACAQRAIETMRSYFDDEGNAYWAWFSRYERVMNGLGCSYGTRSAAHLDLVQEATDPVWRELPRDETSSLLHADLPFLWWQLRTFGIRVVVCCSKAVKEKVHDRLDVEVIESGDTGKRKWSIGNGALDGKRIAVIAWNRPLAQAPGLTREEDVRLGVALREALARADVDLDAPSSAANRGVTILPPQTTQPPPPPASS